jgi:hypothetical protein
MAADWWGLRVAAEVEVPLLRHTFTFDSLEAAHTGRVGGLFWAGFEFRFPRPGRPVSGQSKPAR